MNILKTALKLVFILLLFSLLNISLVLSEEMGEELFSLSLEELMNIDIVTAGKRIQKAEDVSASIYVISRQEIAEMGYATIADAVNTVPGFNFLIDWHWNTPVVRGVRDMFAQRLLFLIDGQATTSKSDMTTIYNYAAPIDIRQVERIEIIRGPGSALYGSGAFLGIINVITKPLGEDTITLNGGVSTIGHKDGYVSVNKTFGDLSYALSASGVDSDGHELDFDFHPGAYAPYPDGIYGITTEGISDGYNTIEDTKFSARISYKDFSLQIFNSTTKIEKPVCDYWTDFNNHDNFTEFDMTLIQARYNHSFSNQFELNNRVYYNDYDQLWQGVYGGEVLLTDSGDDWEFGGDCYGADTQLIYMPYQDLAFTNGLEYTENPDIYAGEIENRSFENYSFYSVLDYTFSEQIKINLGFRAEKYTFRDGIEYIPKAAILLKPTESSVLKLIYGRAFLASSMWELQVAERIGTELKPEINDSYEAVFDWVITDKISSSISLYRMELTDARVIYDSGFPESSEAYNSNNLRITQGLDWQGRFLFPHDISLWLGLSFADAVEEDDATGEKSDLYALSKTLGYGRLRIPLYEKMVGSIGGKYVSATKNFAGGKIDEWYSFDTILFWPEMFYGMGFRLKIGNLFDSDNYAPPPREGILKEIPQSGKYLYLSLFYEYDM